MPEESAEERANRRKRLQFLCNSKDPEAVRCRLFVGSIDTEKGKKPDYLRLFAPFGRVFDLTVHTGYLFVQYDNIQSSLQAIGRLNGTNFMGRAIQVKLAEKGRKAEIAEKEPCKFFAQGNCMRGINCNYMHAKPDQKSGAHGSMSGTTRNGPSMEPNRDRPRREPERQPGPTDRFQEKPREVHLPPPIRDNQRFSDRGSERDRRGPEPFAAATRPSKRSMPDEMDGGSRRPRLSEPGSGGHDFHDRMGSRPADDGRNGPPMAPRRSLPAPIIERKPVLPAPPVGRPTESRRPMMEASHRPSEPPKPVPSPQLASRREAPPVDLRPPYDCVIIAGDEAQRGFCHAIDKKLSEFGMLTNVQVVNGEHLLKRAVEEAARHTVPYTICVTANNEQHRSLTLNILHGVPQEHRNMPLDDAMPFLSRNFDNFVEMMKQKITAVNEWVAPEKKVAYLLNLLAEGRRLVLEEMLQIDNYVQSVVKKLKTTVGSGLSGIDDAGLQGMGQAPAPNHGRGDDRHRAPDMRPPMVSDRHLSDGGRGMVSRPAPDMADGGRMADRGSLLSRPQDQDFNMARNSGHSRPSGGLLGNSGGPGLLSNNANTMLDFESPAVKQALDDLLSSSRPGIGRETNANRGYPF